jgi:hypothetical protein
VRPWFPIRVLALFSVNFVPFPQYKRFPVTETSGMSILVTRGRDGPNIMSSFDSLTPFALGWSVDFFVCLSSFESYSTFPITMPSENSRKGIVPREKFLVDETPKGTYLGQSARNDV